MEKAGIIDHYSAVVNAEKIGKTLYAFAHISLKDHSKILVEQYNSEVPESFNALESLPGVGHKTASVVMSQGFGHPAFPVDTHIHRLAQRWGLTNGKNVIQTEKDLKRL